MNLNKLAAAVVLGLGLASGANAALYTAAPVDAAGVPTGSATFGPNNFFGSMKVVHGAFSDSWNFAVGTTLLSGGSVSDVPLQMQQFNLSLFNIDHLTVDLYEGIAGDAVADTHIRTLAGSGTDYVSDAGVFVPGNYYFTITGQANGMAGGQYLIGVNTLPAPVQVPEPGTLALMLGSLGLMGTLRRRTGRNA